MVESNRLVLSVITHLYKRKNNCSTERLVLVYVVHVVTFRGMLKTRHRLLPAQYWNGITFVWYIQIFLFIDPSLKICLPDVLVMYLKSLYTSLKLKASFFGKTNIADIINIMKLKDKNQHHFEPAPFFKTTCCEANRDFFSFDSYFVKLFQLNNFSLCFL